MAKLSGHEQVVEYLHHLEHPLKAEIEEVRSFILSVDGRADQMECTQLLRSGEDRITLNLQGKGFLRIIFHCGAKVQTHDIKGALPEDTLLEWASNDRAIAKILNLNDLEEKKEQLREVIVRWIEATSKE